MQCPNCAATDTTKTATGGACNRCGARWEGDDPTPTERDPEAAAEAVAEADRTRPRTQAEWQDLTERLTLKNGRLELDLEAANAQIANLVAELKEANAERDPDDRNPEPDDDDPGSVMGAA